MSWMLDLLSWIMLLGGCLVSIIGAIGMLRLPEFFSRMHAEGVAETLGVGLIMGGLLVQAGWSLVGFKLLAILFFLLITSPSSGHALARSAMTHGLLPVLDRDTSSTHRRLPK